MENKEIKVERPAVSFVSRFMGWEDAASLVLVIVYFVWILNMGRWSPGHKNPDNFIWIVAVLVVILYCRAWYRNSWLPAQNYVTKVRTEGNDIYITSVHQNESPIEKKYYYKDVKFVPRPSRLGRILIVIKTLPEASLGDFKPAYYIKPGTGWKNGEVRELYQALQEWQRGLGQGEG